MGKTRALVFTSVGHFVNDGSVFLLPLIVDVLSSLYGASHAEVAVLLFLFYLSSGAFSILVGSQADKTGETGRLMAVGIGLLGIGLVGFYTSMIYLRGQDLFAVGLLCDLGMGFGSSFYHPLGGSILQSSFGRGTAGRALGLNGAMGSVGRALYPTLYVLAAAAFTVPGSMGFFGLLGVAAALFIWAGLGSAKAAGTRRNAGAKSIRGALTVPMVALVAISFVRSAALFGIAAYIPTFLTQQRGLGLGASLGLTMTVFYASAILGQPAFGRLVEKVDHRLVLAASSLGAAASIVGYVNVQGLLGVALLSLFGVFAYTGFPVLMSLAADYAPETASTLSNSLVWGLGATGGNAVGPLLIYALIFNNYNRLGLSFEYMALLAVASAAGAFLIPKPAADKGPVAG
ncbi:MAG: MFS transporter [Nitrososphaerota archaeon]|nr:MFS transporter [Nitrososphaerota archaeon]MDG6956369.1 MFS transporter [Nitrososphaerota archaeon]